MTESPQPPAAGTRRAARHLRAPAPELSIAELHEVAAQVAHALAEHEDAAAQLCGDWPAPCNCDDAQTHDREPGSL